jgi:hypothetical protein
MTAEISIEEYWQLEANTKPEKWLQEKIRRRAIHYGWLFYHTHRSDRSEPGFPDCVMLRDDYMIFAELKRQNAKRYKPSPEQEQWLEALINYADHQHILAEHFGVFLWRPLDLLNGTIDRILE